MYLSCFFLSVELTLKILTTISLCECLIWRTVFNTHCQFPWKKTRHKLQLPFWVLLKFFKNSLGFTLCLNFMTIWKKSICKAIKIAEAVYSHSNVKRKTVLLTHHFFVGINVKLCTEIIKSRIIFWGRIYLRLDKHKKCGVKIITIVIMKIG